MDSNLSYMKRVMTEVFPTPWSPRKTILYFASGETVEAAAAILLINGCSGVLYTPSEPRSIICKRLFASAFWRMACIASAVSKKKKRYVADGFNLDLACVPR